MKIKKLSTAKTLLLASAGKMALTTGVASANHHGGGGGGKGDEGPPPDIAPQLGLNQVAVPFDAIIPPFNDDDIMPAGSMFEDELEGYGNMGMIFVGEIPDGGAARMDFIVNQIRNDQPTDVFLVMGTQLAPDLDGDLFPGLEYMDDMDDMDDMDGPRAGARGDLENQLDQLGAQLNQLLESGAPLDQVERVEKEIQKIERKMMTPSADGQQGPGWKPRPGNGQQPPPVHAGEICVDIDPAKMDIIAGVRVHPSTPLAVQNFQLGKAIHPHFTSTIISIQLPKEKLQQFEGQEVYFQAAAMPVNNPGLDGTQVSECDRFLIFDAAEPDEGFEGSTGSKGEVIPPDTDPSNGGGKADEPM